MSVTTDVAPNNRKNLNVVRVPFPKINDLPAGLQPVAKSVKGMMSTHAFMHMMRSMMVNHYGTMATENRDEFLAEIEDTNNPGLRRRKSLYGGALQVQTSYNGYKMGVYNPDRITIETYERMRRHAQVALSLALIKKPIEHVNFIVDSDSEAIRSLVTWNLKKIYPNLIRDLLMSIDFGSSYLEKVWYKVNNLTLKTRNPKGGAPKIVFNGEAYALKTYAIHPSTIRLLLDKFGELSGLYQESTNGMFNKVAIKRRKLVVMVNNMEYGNWWGDSRLKSAYTWWYWSEVVLQFMMVYLERRSTPPLVVQAPYGYSIDKDGKRVHNYDLALALGTGMMSNSVGVLPAELDKETGKNKWDIKYLNDQERATMFIDVLTYFNKMISRSLWVLDSVGSYDSQSNSTTGSDSHIDMHLVIEESLIRELERVLNEDVVPDIIKLNFAPGDRQPCYVRIEKLTITRKLMLKELLMKLMGVVNQFARDGGLFRVLPDFAEILKLLEIPMADITEVIDFDSWKPAGGENVDTTDDDITSQEKVDENNKDKKRSKRSRDVKRKKSAA